jgi:hypothetical protein
LRSFGKQPADDAQHSAFEQNAVAEEAISQQQWKMSTEPALENS